MEREHTKVEQVDRLNKKEYRVINLDKESYEIIKKYCDSRSLKVSKWIAQQIMNIIKQNKDYE